MPDSADRPFRSVSLPADLCDDLEAALESGVLKPYAVRSKPQALELGVRRLLAEARKGAA